MEKRKTMMSSKDNKRNYADGAEEEARESMGLPKKKKAMNCDDDDSSSTDDFSSESVEEVFSEEEEINLLADSNEKLLIWQARSDDRDTFESENNDSIGNGGDTFDDGSDDEEDKLSNDGIAFD
jgi:hypothetical protein